MFGIGKSKSKGNIKVNVDTPVVNPYDDEPDEWREFTDVEKATAWYKLESLTKDQTMPAITSEDRNLFPQLFDEAHKGNRCAQYTLGKMYLTGTLIQQNTFQAGLWYSQAADQESPFAEYEIGKMMKFGTGFGKDEDSASQLFEKAYQKLLDIESKMPNNAVEKILAVICENQLCEGVDKSSSEHWKQLQRSPAAAVNGDIPISKPVEETDEYTTEEPVSLHPSFKERQVQTLPDMICKEGKYEEVPAEYIVFAENNPYAENDTDETIYAMALSIQTNGLLSPIVLNKISDKKYRIISGEKRFKALSKQLHWKTIPSIVHTHLSKNSERLMLHTANLEVREYTAWQKLRFYVDTEKLLQRMKESGEYSGSLQKGISELLGISTRQVYKYKIIVENLPKSELKQIKCGAESIEKAYLNARAALSEGPEKAPLEAPQQNGSIEISNTGNKTGQKHDEQVFVVEKARKTPEREHSDETEIKSNGQSSKNTEKAVDKPRRTEETKEEARTPRFKDPQSYQESINIIANLPTSPGKSCAVLNENKITIGEVYRIAIYEKSLMISVRLNDGIEEYPVSTVGRSLFLGPEPIVEAKAAIHE